MAPAHTWRSRLSLIWAPLVLRRQKADVRLPVDLLPDSATTKPCHVSGCTGTMYFHNVQEVAHAPHTLEWRWRPTWVCAKDSTHFQVLTAGGRGQILRRQVDAHRLAAAVARRMSRKSRSKSGVIVLDIESPIHVGKAIDDAKPHPLARATRHAEWTIANCDSVIARRYQDADDLNELRVRAVAFLDILEHSPRDVGRLRDLLEDLPRREGGHGWLMLRGSVTEYLQRFGKRD
jgi:hypothetical protein